MTDKRVFILSHDMARTRAANAVEQAPAGYVVEIKEPTRNSEQNARCHAMLADIARQVEHFGKKWPAGVWKRLTVAAFMRESDERPLMIPALDGVGVDVIYERTSQMGVRQMARYIDWLSAFGDEHGVRWSDPTLYPPQREADATASPFR